MNTSTQKISNGLAPYQGTWGKEELLHLLRRTLFGVSKDDINAFAGMNMDETVDALLNYDPTPPLPPINDYNGAIYTDPNVAFGETWVTASLASSLGETSRRKSLQRWSVENLIHQDSNIREKMTLFWLNHLVSSASDVGYSCMAYNYNYLLRTSALGNFKQLIKDVTLSCAMLHYLNGELNKNFQPNENYARELQELFCLGAGSGYTEDDVKAAARILTGYRINYGTYTSYFKYQEHDAGDKQFSTFYNNTIIIGQAGASGAQELDELIDMIFAKDEVALFMCRNLYRFFVYYEINQDIETNVIIPLADTFRTNNYEILPVMSQLLKSEHFFDMVNRGCLIKSPIDFVISYCRQFSLVFPDNTDLLLKAKHYNYIADTLYTLFQLPLDPPNVAGWPAYYQAPSYHELWINSASVPIRAAFLKRMTELGYSNGGFTLKIDIIAFTESLENAYNPNMLIDEVLELLYGIQVNQTMLSSWDSFRQSMKDVLLSGQSDDSYWTYAWSNYLQMPNDPVCYQVVYSRLASLYGFILNSDEYHLS